MVHHVKKCDQCGGPLIVFYKPGGHIVCSIKCSDAIRVREAFEDAAHEPDYIAIGDGHGLAGITITGRNAQAIQFSDTPQDKLDEMHAEYWDGKEWKPIRNWASATPEEILESITDATAKLVASTNPLPGVDKP